MELFMQIKYGPIGQVYMELTNICNFDCAFCPNEIMTRKKGVMKKETAIRILDEISDINLTKKMMFHLMGEPTLHPNLTELITYANDKGIKIVLNTNGARLDGKLLDRVYNLGLDRLIISLQTPTEGTYSLRRARMDFPAYISKVKDIVRKKFEQRSNIPLELHLLNSTDARLLGLDEDFIVLENDKIAQDILLDWIKFGKDVEKEHDVEKVRHDMKKIRKISLKNGFRYEIVRGVHIISRRTTTWANTMVKGKRIIPAFLGSCDGLKNQFGILWDGRCVMCCIDYDGKTALGNVNDTPLSKIWLSKDAERIRKNLQRNILVHPYCQICRGGANITSWAMRQLGSIAIYKLGFNYIFPD